MECYYYTLCSLLNLSTLKTNQILIARKGLRVLLGIISYFSRQHGMAEPEQELEKKLYFLASSVVQNLSLHPKNRTAFYKAELKVGDNLRDCGGHCLMLAQGRWI